MELQFLFLFGVGIVFALLIYWKLVPFYYRYIFLVVLIFAIVLFVINHNLDTKSLGFTPFTLTSIFIYLSITGLGLTVSSVFDVKVKMGRVNKRPKENIGTVWYVLLSVPLQELMSRGFILGVFEKAGWSNVWLYTITTAFIFSFMHIFFRNKMFVILTGILGLVLGPVYFFWPNIWLASLSHAILGILNVEFKLGKNRKDLLLFR